MTKRILPTPERLRELLSYDPETGKLHWKPRPVEVFSAGNTSSEANCKAWNSKWSGREALNSGTGNGYLHGAVDYQSLLAHRVVWAVYYGEWPTGAIDHINGCKHDNRIQNLREASRSQNSINTGIRVDNTSGHKGVSWKKDRNKWRARISFDGSEKYLGSFDSYDDAVAAYDAAAKKHHGEFARKIEA